MGTLVKISDDQIRSDPNRCPTEIRSDNLHSDRNLGVGLLIASTGVDPIRSYSRFDRFLRSPYGTSPLDIKLNLEKIGFIRRNR